MINRVFEKLILVFGLEKLISRNTLKNISTVFTGTFFATVIPILFSPVMTRLYNTADYGVLGIYIAINGLIGVIAYVHYPQAIMLAKDIDKARQVMWFSIFFSSGIAILSLLIIVSLYNFVPSFYNSVLKFWIFFIPLSVFLNGISSSVMTWANRNQHYKVLASNRIIQAIATVVVQICIGLLFKNETGLMLGFIGGQILGVILLWVNFKKPDMQALDKPQIGYFKGIAIEYRRLLIFSTSSEFINNLINQMPIFLLQRFSGISYVGSYNFTQRLLGMPQQFLSTAIVEVFRQKASHQYNETGENKQLFQKTFKSLVLLSFPIFLILFFFSPILFEFVFGKDWKLAGELARFLCIMFFFRFVGSPLSYMYYIAGKFKEDLLIHILFLIITILSFYVANQVFADKRFLLLTYSISYSIAYIFTIARSYHFSKGKY